MADQDCNAASEEAYLFDKIRSVSDPVSGQSLIESKRLMAAELKESNARFVIRANGLTAEQRTLLEKQISDLLQAEPSVAKTYFTFVLSKPKPKIIAVASGKGGVGKSTLSAALALLLKQKGRRVGLVDADIYGPSQALLMGAKQQSVAAVGDQLRPVVTADGIAMLSMGQIADPNQAIAWRGPKIAGAFNQLMAADWSECDVLIVDLPPGTGDIQLSMVREHKPDGVLIISTPQDMALIDAKRAVDLFRKTETPIIGLIENMAGYQCPHCGEISDPFGAGGAELAAADMGIDFWGYIPLGLNIRLAADSGHLGDCLKDSAEGAAAAFSKIAERLGVWVDQQG
ncbi:Mrp family Chromosome partitioning ATPase [Zymomonas mobilis subsp. mobilis ZM4 = ATCC 31821]|uniref:Iron-sulfur cluster carrier protein n=1 Tax=Zymomonas mobilis subsp. mobilis (strain ATCC 31821 / ZM4 / CP4) TaxID=264203 RepID=Q5NQZ4_ZYMMO|nr:Mrp/NBP35 family ATP-binding protein [Zymomonas mobilis]AAV88860.1 ATPase involved in chromosome partitioning-like protein [Zymomonas mobilis subsp. mobilis ZM4 = ATCC 31821]AVZ25242.1 Mrp family Chromosome partitioning ATPase [Zymomonas mobilis subsp. mobilis]AVZ27133.1 Mrp family Chromosome partitioning ATPase [Zymomonas mobilis subsp. mobilis]AVZ41579.1 Mrp family Chromosome partitioning ATPase [Zymomonas mobilis subsp. mobilis ZM4 = ATCC 31821]UBQ08061.1 Mrp/NBP35 family ATP-binding pro